MRLTQIWLEIYRPVVIKYHVITQAIKSKIAEWQDFKELYFFFLKLNAPKVFSISCESRRFKKKVIGFLSFFFFVVVIFFYSLRAHFYCLQSHPIVYGMPKKFVSKTILEFWVLSIHIIYIFILYLLRLSILISF